MSQSLKIALFIVLLLGVAAVWAMRIGSAGGDRQTVADGAGIQWLNALPAIGSNGMNEKPTLVYFTADWCPPCRTMRDEAWVDTEVVAAAEPYTPVMIDNDANPALVTSFRVSGIPTVIVLDTFGKEVHRRSGYGSGGQAELAEWLRNHAK